MHQIVSRVVLMTAQLASRIFILLPLTSQQGETMQFTSVCLGVVLNKTVGPFPFQCINPETFKGGIAEGTMGFQCSAHRGFHMHETQGTSAEVAGYFRFSELPN